MISIQDLIVDGGSGLSESAANHFLLNVVSYGTHRKRWRSHICVEHMAQRKVTHLTHFLKIE